MMNSPSRNWVEGLRLTRAEARSIDAAAIEDFQVPSIVLMENAGKAMADILLEQRPSGIVTIVAGTGNNGGDGFVIARHLVNCDVDIRLLVVGEFSKLDGDPATNFEILRRSGIAATELGDSLPDSFESDLQESEWIVDALLGTGLKGAARSPAKEVIQHINAAGRKVLAVDVPSGFDCDDGPVAETTVQAKITATCVARKVGFDHPNASAFLGDVKIIDIGAPVAAIRKAIAEAQMESN